MFIIKKLETKSFYHFLAARQPKDLKNVTKIGYGHLCPIRYSVKTVKKKMEVHLK